jgi:rubrerythrin
MSTEDNLKDAFAGESQANRRYLAFAKKAEEEGHKQVAKLFRAAAEAETVHALNHLNILGVGITEENLKEAIKGEHYENTEMYPKFIEEAKTEGNEQANMSFSGANEVEKIHEELYKKALENLGKNEELDYYVCSVCGNTVEGESPDVCIICGQPKEKFRRIE